MGAKVVGEPSRQAPNTFMESTPYSLPYTKMRGSISNAVQQCLPDNDMRAKVFWPEMRPTYEDYKRYDFSFQALGHWILDKIKEQQ